MKNSAQKLKNNLVHYAIYSILAFILLSAILSFWNRYVLYDTQSIKDKALRTDELAKSIKQNLLKDIQLGINSYGISKREADLDYFNAAVAKKDSIFKNLEQLLVDQNFETSKLLNIKLATDLYIKEGRKIIEIINNEDTLKLFEALKSFKFSADEEYESFVKEVFVYENERAKHAQSDYEWSIADNAIIQVILVLLSVPILIIASRRLRKEVKNSQKLLSGLDENNRIFLFDDGTETPMNAKSVVDKSINSFKQAFDFVEHVSKGDYSKAKTLLKFELQTLNEKTLMGALSRMSDKLQKAEDEDKKRQWISNGINQFTEIVRNNQSDLKALADKTVVFLTKYLDSQQASLFSVVNDGEDKYLELDACYAFNRKKWFEKKIDVGTGLVGQAYMEGEPILLTEVPNNYTHITSGLGDATPSCLLIVPFIYNEKIEAVFEVAAFYRYEIHHIEFLKKAGEFLGAALQTVKNNNAMQMILNQSVEQAETLKAQEEELRQNMEELEATNEALKRKEREK